MRVDVPPNNHPLPAKIRARLAAERGFTMVIALGVLVVTSLLVGSTYTAIQADAPLAQRDLEGKRAYYAARAGVNRFLYELNQNPNLWQTCPTSPKDMSGNLIKTPIAPGSGEKYTYVPVPVNPSIPCSPSPPTTGDPISTLIDPDTGTFRMRFIGYAGNPEVKRGIIASFRKDTPLDYLWFTIYETLDPNTYPVPANYADCNKWERAPYNRDPKCRDIRFITGDDLNGPTYTQDQYLIDGSPNFGRTGTNDKTESSVESTNPVDVCMYSDCETATFRGTRAPSAPTITPPPSNDQLLTDATRYGCGSGGCGSGNPPGVQTGVTKIELAGTQLKITNCQVTCGAVQTRTIDKFPNGTPIVYVKNASSGCDPTYTPYNPTYPATGPCGTVYVHGDYTRSVTIAAQTDIIVDGPITKNPIAPAPVLGLTANNFVRVMHGIGGRPAGADQGDCGTNTILDGNPSGEPDQTLTDLQIDAAILAIRHSFIVDNFDCGTHASVGELTVNGAIAQTFRGTVGTGGPSTGYLKDYNYDDRFEIAQPPYLFNIASSSWRVERETLCVVDGTAPTTMC